MIFGEIISELINGIPVPITTGKRNKEGIAEFPDCLASMKIDLKHLLLFTMSKRLKVNNFLLSVERLLSRLCTDKTAEPVTPLGKVSYCWNVEPQACKTCYILKLLNLSHPEAKVVSPVKLSISSNVNPVAPKEPETCRTRNCRTHRTVEFTEPFSAIRVIILHNLIVVFHVNPETYWTSHEEI